MANRSIERFLSKRTAVSGRRPTGTTGNELSFIQQGELAVNTADHELWSFDGTDEFRFFDKTYLSFSGGTVTGETTFSSLFSTDLSGGTIYSGGTDLDTIIRNIANSSEDVTRVQPGLNITTGGTDNFPLINLVDNPSINNLTISGVGLANEFSASTLSGGTLYSGSTDLDAIIRGIDTYVTGGTLSSGGTLSIDRSDAVVISVTGFSTSDQVIKESGLLDVYQSGTTVTTGATGAYVDIFWDSDILVGSAYSRSSAEITIQEDGIYEVTYCASIDVSSGGRKSSRVRLVLDEGSGFNEVIRSGAFGYHRNTGNGEDTIAKIIKQRFSSGDIIKTQMSVFSGAGILVTIANDSNITITKMTL